MAEGPDEILARLREGNRRSQESGRAARPPRPRELSVALLTCTDERIVPEVVFDQPPGAFYTLRIAGAVYSPEVAGSLEVAVVLHGCPLVLVLGHSGCSAVALARSRPRVEGSLYELVRRIRPGLEGLPADAGLDEAVAANVRHTLRELRERCRSLRERENAGTLRMAGAVYEFGTGAVHPVFPL